MFYDDASLIDLLSAKGSGQECLGRLLQLLGGSFKKEKQQRMSSSVDFLGLIHSVKDVSTKGRMSFFPRDALVEKTTTLTSIAIEEDRLIPTQAGKLLGLRAFLESCMFGRTGKLGNVH